MHPSPVFQQHNRAAMLDFVRDRGFAHIFSAGASGLRVVHAPVFVTAAGTIQFHVARRNAATGQMAGNPILVSLSATDGYQSASWYRSANQVPTWHYQAVEIEGTARVLGRDELIELLDWSSDLMEQVHASEPRWTRVKMTAGTFEAMLEAVTGFEVVPGDVRGTRKFNQHKGPEDRSAAIAGQQGIGRHDIAEELARSGP